MITKKSKTLSLALALVMTLGPTAALAAEGDYFLKADGSMKYSNNQIRVDAKAKNHVRVAPGEFEIEVNGVKYDFVEAREAYDQDPVNWKAILAGEEVAPEGELKVVEVSAINAEELLVTFSKDVSASAEDVNNYEISLNGTKVAGSTAILDIHVDGKTALIRLNDTDSTVVGNQFLRGGDKVVVQTTDAITAITGEAFPKFASEEFVYSIKEKATIKKTVLNDSANTLTITFDRPVNTATTLVKVDGIDIVNKNLVPVLRVADSIQEAGNYNYTIAINHANVTAAQLKSFKAEGIHEVVLFDVADTAAANPVVASVVTGTYTVAKDTAAPVVVSMTAINANKFFIETNRPVTLTDATLKVEKGAHEFVKGNVGSDYSQLDYIADYYKTKPGVYVVITDANPDGLDENPLYRGTESSVTLKVTFENYKANDLTGSLDVRNITLKKDAAKPEVKSTSLDVTNNKLVVTFKDNLDAAPALSDIIVRDKEAVVITPSSVALNSTDSSIVEVTFGAAVIENDKAPYTIEFKAGKMQYAEVKTSVPVYVAKSLKNDKLVATVRSSATGFKYKAFGELSASITDANNVIEIDYNTEMTDTARQAANYNLDGKALPAGTTVDFIGDKENVVITLPEGSVRTTTGYKLTISTNVTTKNNEHIVKDLQTKGAYEEVVNLADNVKPELKSAVYVVATNDATATDKIKVTFNEDLASSLTNSENNLQVVINGSKQTVISVVQSSSDADVLEITLKTPVAISQSATITIVKDNAGDVNIKDTSALANTAKVGSSIVANTKELDLNAPTPPANNAPTVKTIITDITVAANAGVQTVNLQTAGSEVFEDIDGDTLTYTVAIDTDTDSILTTVTEAGGVITITPEGTNTGTATIKVEANDGNGGVVSTTFMITLS